MKHKNCPELLSTAAAAIIIPNQIKIPGIADDRA
jgi:hypothetical protein